MCRGLAGNKVPLAETAKLLRIRDLMCSNWFPGAAVAVQGCDYSRNLASKIQLAVHFSR